MRDLKSRKKIELSANLSKNAIKWPKNGQKLPKMAQSGPNMTPNGPRMTQNGPKWPKNDPKWAKITPNGPKMTPEFTHFFRNFFYCKSGSANFFTFRMYGEAKQFLMQRKILRLAAKAVKSDSHVWKKEVYHIAFSTFLKIF